MSKAVLLSIRPEWCEKILSGEKTVEIARPPQSWGYVRELEEVRNEQEGE